MTDENVVCRFSIMAELRRKNVLFALLVFILCILVLFSYTTLFTEKNCQPLIAHGIQSVRASQY